MYVWLENKLKLKWFMMVDRKISGELLLKNDTGKNDFAKTELGKKYHPLNIEIIP